MSKVQSQNSAAKAAQQQVQPPPPPPPRRPIDILPDQISFFAANLQPVVVLSLIFVSFRALVRDPVSTLTGLAPTIAIVQSAYCILCLPSTGQAPPPPVPSNRSSTSGGSGQQSKRKGTGRSTQDLGARIVPAILSLLLTIFLSTPTLYIAVILFGAPLTSATQATLLLALHLALLATPHLFYAHGLDAQTWLRIASLQLPVDEGYGMSLGALFGAWLGAIPIPLDWDREWQRWPVTIVVGVYLGAVVGKLAGAHVFKGKQMKIT